MKSSEYRAALDKLGLTQVGWARLLGYNDVTARRWASTGIDKAPALVLKLLVRKKITLKDVAEARVGR